MVSSRDSSASTVFSFKADATYVPTFLTTEDFSFGPPVKDAQPLGIVSPIVTESTQAFLPIATRDVTITVIVPTSNPSFKATPSKVYA